ncbi:MAG: class I SAM-dependent methyltransferase [Nitrososphaerales archaeon]
MSTFAKFFERVQKTAFYRRLLLRFIDFLQREPDMLILDIGCGPGALAIELAKRVKEVKAVDYSIEMIERARAYAMHERIENVEFRIGNAEQIPFSDNTFDAVAATSVIYLLYHPSIGIEEMARVVKPNGIVATLDPSYNMTRKNMEIYCKRNSLTGFELTAAYGWVDAAKYNHRFTKNDIESIYHKCGLWNVRIIEEMVLFAEGLKTIVS